MDFWQQLSRAREQAGLSLDELARRTKIRRSILDALERGDLAALGAAFYARAFIRAYAAQVGIDPGPAIQQYDERLAPPAPPSVPPPAGNRALRLMVSNSLRVLPVAMAGLAGILLVVAFSISRKNELATVPGGQVEAVGTGGTQSPTPPSQRVEGTAQPRDTAESNRPESLKLEIRPTAPLWLAGTADGQRVIYRLLQPGETVVLDTRNELQLRIGNAEAFDYSINGRPGRRLGGPGEALTISLTPDNYRRFLQPVPG